MDPCIAASGLSEARKTGVRESAAPAGALPVVIEPAARAAVEAHLAEDPRVELGGVLVGRVDASGVTVCAAVAAREARGTARSFTFDPPAWTAVTDELSRRYPDLVVVGWYHSHPGLGVHLSEHDRFLCSTFFPEAWQVAWVLDPRRGESGLYVRGGTKLVSGESGARLAAPTSRDRRRWLGAGVLAAAAALFGLGYAVHSSSPPGRVSFTAPLDGGAVTEAVTVTERGTTAELTETFGDAAKKDIRGTVSPCLPSGALLGSYSGLQIVAPDGCVLDLTVKHPTAAITASGPAATVLAGVGPGSFRLAPNPKSTSRKTPPG